MEGSSLDKQLLQRYTKVLFQVGYLDSKRCEEKSLQDLMESTSFEHREELKNLKPRLILEHKCVYSACNIEGCKLCKNAKERQCLKPLNDHYYQNDNLRSRCQQQLKIRLSPYESIKTSGYNNIKIRVFLIDSHNIAMQQLDLCPSKLYECRLKQNSKDVQASKPLIFTSSQNVKVEIDYVEMFFQGEVQLPEFRITSNSEGLIGLKRKGVLKLVTVAVDQDDNILNEVIPAVTNEFMVYSRRSRPNGKVDIPKRTDPVDIIYHIGKQTSDKLANLAKLFQADGLQVSSLPPALHEITQVYQLKMLVELCREDGQLENQMQNFLGLKKEGWKDIENHLAKAVEIDDTCRVYICGPTNLKDQKNGDIKGLIYECKSGVVNFSNIKGIIQHCEYGNEPQDVLVEDYSLNYSLRQKIQELSQMARIDWNKEYHKRWDVLDQRCSAEFYPPFKQQLQEGAFIVEKETNSLQTVPKNQNLNNGGLQQQSNISQDQSELRRVNTHINASKNDQAFITNNSYNVSHTSTPVTRRMANKIEIVNYKPTNSSNNINNSMMTNDQETMSRVSQLSKRKRAENSNIIPAASNVSNSNTHAFQQHFQNIPTSQSEAFASLQQRGLLGANLNPQGDQVPIKVEDGRQSGQPRAGRNQQFNFVNQPQLPGQQPNLGLQGLMNGKGSFMGGEQARNGQIFEAQNNQAGVEAQSQAIGNLLQYKNLYQQGNQDNQNQFQGQPTFNSQPNISLQWPQAFSAGQTTAVEQAPNNSEGQQNGTSNGYQQGLIESQQISPDILNAIQQQLIQKDGQQIQMQFNQQGGNQSNNNNNSSHGNAANRSSTQQQQQQQQQTQQGLQQSGVGLLDGLKSQEELELSKTSLQFDNQMTQHYSLDFLESSLDFFQNQHIHIDKQGEIQDFYTKFSKFQQLKQSMQNQQNNLGFMNLKPILNVDKNGNKFGN